MSKTYSFEELEKIVNKIKKIKKKTYLEEIRDIIIKHNPQIKITQNSNGLFIHFDNLNQITYSKINSFIKSINKKNEIYDFSLSTEENYTSDNANDETINSSEKYDFNIKCNDKINLIDNNYETQNIFVKNDKKN